MSQQVFTFSEETIKQMMQTYNDKLTDPPQGAVFRARTEHCTITAYRSKKVLFQGKNALKEASKWNTGAMNISKPSKPKTNKNSRKTNRTISESLYKVLHGSHLGSDESGTGDYFGPMTAASVYVSEDQINQLKILGVDDSKKLTDATIKTLAKELIQLNVPYSLLVLHNEKYNHLQKNGWSQGKMKAMLHYHVINNLIKKIGNTYYEGIVIDQFCQPAVFQRYLASENKTIMDKSHFMTKAENYSIAVAAASIIARASFVKEMDRLSDSIGYSLLKGASSKVDELGAQIIRAKGEAVLNKIAKVHFANTQKAMRYL